MAHTPTPWSLRRQQIVDSTGSVVARITDNVSHGCDCPTPDVASANADLIVEAVNSYASLRAKLEIAEKALDACPLPSTMGNVQTHYQLFYDWYNSHCDPALTAIREGRE